MTTMSPPALLAHQVKYEQKAFWRNPPAALFTFAFPLMFLFIFGSLNANSHVDFLHQIKFDQYFVPAITAYGVISSCYTALGIQIPLRRDSGQLKRLRSTPLPTWAAIGGYIANSLVIAVLLIVVMLGFGTLVAVLSSYYLEAKYYAEARTGNLVGILAALFAFEDDTLQLMPADDG